MIAAADLAIEKGSTYDKVIILQPLDPSDRATAFTQCLETILKALDYNVQRGRIGHEFDQASNYACVSLLELESSVLSACDEETFIYTQNIMLNCQNMLWVTAFDNPAAAVVTGLLRSVRNEVPGNRCRTINIQPASLATPYRCGNMLAILFATST